MTPEEKGRALLVLKEAAEIAERHGTEIVNECNQKTGVCMASAAIMFSTFCASADMSMHDAVGLFMSIHKQTQSMIKERDLS